MKTLALFLLSCLALQSRGSHELYMGNLTTYGYEVEGKVYAIDKYHYRIEWFTYDGLGPGVYVYYDSATSGPDESGKEATFWEVVNGTAIEDPLSQFKVGRRFDHQQIVIKLQSGDTVGTTKWISIWCRPFGLDFGSIIFSPEKLEEAASIFCPQTTPVPTPTPTVPTATLSTETPTQPPPPPIICELLADNYAMCWKKNQSPSVTFTICNANLATDQYLGFGLSGSNTMSQMIGSDVTICSFEENAWSVRDYYLQRKLVCKRAKKRRPATGVCPDTVFGGTDQLFNKAIGMRDGVKWCSFARNFTSNENTYDRNSVNPQPIVWAVGPVRKGKIVRHTRRTTQRAQIINLSHDQTTPPGRKCGDMVSCCLSTL